MTQLWSLTPWVPFGWQTQALNPTDASCLTIISILVDMTIRGTQTFSDSADGRRCEGRKPPWTFPRQSLLLGHCKSFQVPLSFMLKVSRVSDMLKIRSAAMYAKFLLLASRYFPPLPQQKIFKASFQIACLNKIQWSFLLSSLLTLFLAVWHRLQSEEWAEHLDAHRPSGIIWAQQSLLPHELTEDIWVPSQRKGSRVASAYPQCPEIIK